MRIWHFIASFILLVGCDRDRPACFMRAGDDTIITRPLSADIRSLEIYDLIHVELYFDGKNEAVLKGPSNVMRRIITEESDGTLVIRDENRCNWVRDLSIRPSIELHVNEIAQLFYEGQGDVLFADTLTTDVFSFDAPSGVGDLFLRLNVDSANVEVHAGLPNVSLQGEARVIGLFNQGYGLMDASELRAQFVLSNNSSINEMRVWAEQYLYAYLSSSGNTEYHGEPNTIDVFVHGTGELVNAN